LEEEWVGFDISSSVVKNSLNNIIDGLYSIGRNGRMEGGNKDDQANSPEIGFRLKAMQV
jgi:hypothetical protein